MSKPATTRTWLCCHNCRWIESATYREPTKINADGFCLGCGDPACDPFDPDFPYEQDAPIAARSALGEQPEVKE